MAKRRHLRICPYCIEEIKSHGEKIISYGTEYDDAICEWCEEPTDEYEIIAFR